jgi:AcrR family transcriptional regulator
MTTIAPSAPGRDRILEAAATLFVGNGYAETSLRDIAATAGMKAGSVYYHFASKDEIIEQVLREGMLAMERAFDDASARAAGHDPEARLRLHVAAHLEALFGHGPFTAAHVTMFHTVPDGVRDVVVPLRDAYEDRWGRLLDELSPGTGSPSIARLMLLGALNSTLEWYDPQGSQTVERLATDIVAQFWHGFGGRQ